MKKYNFVLTIKDKYNQLSQAEKLFSWGGIGYFIVSALITFYGLFGHFRHKIFGVNGGYIWDPGSYYLTSGAYLFRVEYANFFGHPGTILQFIIALITESSYQVYRLFINDIPYELFLVKNYPSFIFVFSLVITIINIFSCYVIFCLSKRFWESQIPGLIAAFVYGTSFPFLMYINKISPDQVAVLLILLSLLFSWKFFEAMEAGNERRAHFHLIMSAFLGTSACFSKMWFGVPYFGVLILFLFFFRHNLSKQTYSKLSTFVIFSLVSIATACIWSTKVNWDDFTNFWIGLLSSKKAQVNTFTISDNILTIKITLKNMLESIYHYTFNSIWPPNPEIGLKEIIYVAEYIYIITAIIGIWLFLRKSSQNRSGFYSLVLLLLFSTPAAYYRPGPHYFLIPMATMSIPFSFVIFYLSDMILSKGLSSKKIIIILCSFVLLIHYTSICFVYNSKLNDIISYQNSTKPFYRTLHKIDYGEQIAIVSPNPELVLFGQGFEEYAPPELLDAFYSFFQPVSSLEEANDYSEKIRYIGYFEDGEKAVVFPAQGEE